MNEVGAALSVGHLVAVKGLGSVDVVGDVVMVAFVPVELVPLAVVVGLVCAVGFADAVVTVRVDTSVVAVVVLVVDVKSLDVDGVVVAADCVVGSVADIAAVGFDCPLVNVPDTC